MLCVRANQSFDRIFKVSQRYTITTTAMIPQHAEPLYRRSAGGAPPTVLTSRLHNINSGSTLTLHTHSRDSSPAPSPLLRASQAAEPAARGTSRGSFHLTTPLCEHAQLQDSAESNKNLAPPSLGHGCDGNSSRKSSVPRIRLSVVRRGRVVHYVYYYVTRFCFSREPISA